MAEAARSLAVRPPGMLDALAHPAFAIVSGATLVSNIGVWMRDTTSAWTVATGGNASAVALVQAATTAPTLVLALPAGVLADHYDRRRLLIACQIVLAGVGLALAGLSAVGQLGVAAIAVLALVAGSASALAAPAFQAVVPAMVPAGDLRSAVALSSISYNVARVIGPAIGGAVLAAAGAASAYMINAVGYGIAIVALLLIRMPTPALPPRPVAFRSELHEGLAFVAASATFRHVLARAMGLYLCAACYLTLTPVIGHAIDARDPGIYGILLAAIGIGSLGGGLVLSVAHRLRCGDDRLLTASSLGSAMALAMLSIAHDVASAAGALALAGAMTLLQLATLNAVAQLILPAAIRGRGLAIYLSATVGCMAIGSLMWGAVADTFGLSVSLALGAAGFVAVAISARWAPIGGATGSAA